MQKSEQFSTVVQNNCTHNNSYIPHETSTQIAAPNLYYNEKYEPISHNVSYQWFYHAATWPDKKKNFLQTQNLKRNFSTKEKKITFKFWQLRIKFLEVMYSVCDVFYLFFKTFYILQNHISFVNFIFQVFCKLCQFCHNWCKHMYSNVKS